MAGAGDHHPVVAWGAFHLHAEQLGVEGGERVGVRGVDDDGVQLADHAPILTTLLICATAGYRSPLADIRPPGLRGREAVSDDRGMRRPRRPVAAR